MSIRNYTPRRRRHGVSAFANGIQVGTMVAALFLQITYPLLSGEALRVVTIATVYFGAAAMFVHARLAYGWKYTGRYLLITLPFAFLIELIGENTGWPFGTYSYDPSLGPQLLGIPIVVPFAWAMMAHPLLIVARRMTKKWTFLYGGFALMAWDLFLDPQMVGDGRWKWEVTGSHVPFQPDIPLSNMFGWLLAGIALMAILNVSLPKEQRKYGSSLIAIDIFLAWSLFGGIISNLFFFDRPGVALFGGLFYTLALAPYFFARWLGRP
jgi:putative membrane protein